MIEKPANYRALWQYVSQLRRVRERVEAAGLKLEVNRVLATMTDQIWNNGRLVDATVKYEWRVEVTGKTYRFREFFKGLGLRWDAGRKAWWAFGGEEGQHKLGQRICRHLDS